MLSPLAGSIPARERVITCDEVFEFRLGHGDVVALQCRQPDFERTGDVTLRRLVKEASRGSRRITVRSANLSDGVIARSSV
ncbi:hypothetical protein [Actinotalea solisilvae]|uniref:hypothetical protein n=1 Tax=Actinotalea solisilvae TaxID=2072922 RepID=UPI001F2BE60F|nr:hypothetical protein [Actinotalea solisilvae]